MLGLQTFVDNLATRELITDVVLSAGNNLPVGPDNNFDNVRGGFSLSHLSAHLKSRVPAGGNVAYKDGHVQWKRFKAANSNANLNDSKVRTGINTPYFWW